jgi:hypothetical protein
MYVAAIHWRLSEILHRLGFFKLAVYFREKEVINFYDGQQNFYDMEKF